MAVNIRSFFHGLACLAAILLGRYGARAYWVSALFPFASHADLLPQFQSYNFLRSSLGSENPKHKLRRKAARPSSSTDLVSGAGCTTVEVAVGF